MSGRHMANTALAKARNAKLTSTILRADSDTFCFTSPLETEGRGSGVCGSGHARDTRD